MHSQIFWSDDFEIWYLANFKTRRKIYKSSSAAVADLPGVQFHGPLEIRTEDFAIWNRDFLETRQKISKSSSAAATDPLSVQFHDPLDISSGDFALWNRENSETCRNNSNFPWALPAMYRESAFMASLIYFQVITNNQSKIIMDSLWKNPETLFLTSFGAE